MKIVHLQNAHTSVLATGIALSAGTAYYLAGAGAGESVKAIWASAVSNNGGILAPEFYSTSQQLSMEPGSKYNGQRLPDSSYFHFAVITTDPNVLMLIDPKLAAAEETDSVAARLAQMEEIYFRFYLWMKKNLAVPVQRAWTKTIFEEALDVNVGGIKQLSTFGDCLGAWQIKPEHHWTSMIAGMVRDHHLTIR